MANKLFHEARLKIQRAEKHVNDLNGILKAFLNGKPYVVFVEHNPDGSGDLLKVTATKTLPPDFVLTLGDALHNLRTALDYAMNEIEFQTCGVRTAYTKFPVYDSREGLVAAANGALKQKAPKQVIDCLLGWIQPYKGGKGDAIWSLHQIDIEDKHRLLIANTELNFIRGIRTEDDSGEEYMIDDWLIVPGKVAAMPIQNNRNVKVTNEGNASYVVTFGQGMPFQGRYVIPVAESLVKMTGAILDELEYWLLLSAI